MRRVVTIHLSEAAWSRLEELANKEGVPKTTQARDLLVGALAAMADDSATSRLVRIEAALGPLAGPEGAPARLARIEAALAGPEGVPARLARIEGAIMAILRARVPAGNQQQTK